MVYVILITFSISQVIQAGLAIYLFVQLQRLHRLLIEDANTIPSGYSPVMGSAPPLEGYATVWRARESEYTIPSASLLDDAVRVIHKN